MTIATDLITAERERQITEKGWTAEHDAGRATELLYAAASYVEAAEAIRYLPVGDEPKAAADGMRQQPPLNWPWSAENWRPNADPIRDLVKAGALIAAAIDSLHTGGLDCQVCYGERTAVPMRAEMTLGSLTVVREPILPAVLCGQEGVTL